MASKRFIVLLVAVGIANVAAGHSVDLRTQDDESSHLDSLQYTANRRLQLVDPVSVFTIVSATLSIFAGIGVPCRTRACMHVPK